MLLLHLNDTLELAPCLGIGHMLSAIILVVKMAMNYILLLYID